MTDSANDSAFLDEYAHDDSAAYVTRERVVSDIEPGMFARVRS